MAHLVRLPAMGQTMEEGTILRWMKAEGDRVEKGDPLAEIMTDKVNMDLESPEAGVLLKLLEPVDATVPVQSPICILGEAGEDISALIGAEPGSAASGVAMAAPGGVIASPGIASTAPGVALASFVGRDALAVAAPPSGAGPTAGGSSPRARRAAVDLSVDLSSLPAGTGPRGRILERDVVALAARAGESRTRITPLAQRIASDVGLETAGLSGSGPGGKIRSEDVRQAASPPTPILVDPTAAGPQRVPLTRMRALIAKNIAQSAQTAPHVNMTMEVDVTELARLRTSLLPAVEKRHGVRLTYTDLLAKATVIALLDHPILNSSWDGDAILLHPEVHLGVAVAVADGLLVPTVRSAQAKSLPEISREIKDLAGRARENRLKPDEISGGTFTITNLGGYGVDSFTPIINPPQCAILGVGRMVERPAFGPNREVEARSFMNLCLSFDHRIVDGAPAAEFLRSLRELLENPHLILI